MCIFNTIMEIHFKYACSDKRTMWLKILSCIWYATFHGLCSIMPHKTELFFIIEVIKILILFLPNMYLFLLVDSTSSCFFWKCNKYFPEPVRKPSYLEMCLYCFSISCAKSRISYLPMRLTTWSWSCLQQLADRLLFLKVGQLLEEVR
jgi:hypothetical protein